MHTRSISPFAVFSDGRRDGRALNSENIRPFESFCKTKWARRSSDSAHGRGKIKGLKWCKSNAQSMNPDKDCGVSAIGANAVESYQCKKKARIRGNASGRNVARSPKVPIPGKRSAIGNAGGKGVRDPATKGGKGTEVLFSIGKKSRRQTAG